MDDTQHKIMEQKTIQDAFDALLANYLASNHRKKTEIVQKAFDFANSAHKGVKRRSGEPYIMHPIAVAQVVCKEMGLGSTSICSALLHDVIEDTEYTRDDLQLVFGEKIAEIVEGLTKISSHNFGKNVNLPSTGFSPSADAQNMDEDSDMALLQNRQSDDTETPSLQAENLRKLLLTMSQDIRVILIKIADRLHNMRTLSSMPPDKQQKITGETIYIYAPIAHRLGLFAIKTELEDLSFKYQNPEIYNSIVEKLHLTQRKRDNIYKRFVEPIKARLDTLGFNYELKDREKSVYSIFNKMQNKEVPFEEIYDIYAVRIIFESEPDVDERKRCWDIYNAITDIYQLKPDRIRDWVNRPKANGYQALHLTVMGPDGEWVEVQIRSKRMDEIAEKGLAAHWQYKTGKIEEDEELNKWLSAIQEILENPNPNAVDFLATIKLNLYTQEIFVFTPKGDMRMMPQGATALDFAYELHSNIGDHSISAKINHQLMPLSTKLNSGDQIQILTSKTASPQEEWLDFVTTARAKTKLQYALRRQRKEVAKKGEVILKEALQKENIELSLQVLDKLLMRFGQIRKEDLFYILGTGELELPADLKKFIASAMKDKQEGNIFMRYVKNIIKTGKKETQSASEPAPVPLIDRKKTYVLHEDDNFKKNFVTMDCCHPIPGDKAVGFVTAEGKVEIHTAQCPEGIKQKTAFGDRIVNVEWSKASQFSFLASIHIKGVDRIGMLNDITHTITSHDVNIKKLLISADNGVFDGSINLYVHHTREVEKLAALLKHIDGIDSVNRSNKT